MVFRNQTQNALARTVIQAQKFQHITPILKSLHWLNELNPERIEYKIISITYMYKIINTTQPSYIYDLVSIQPPHGHNTRCSPYVTLIKPSSSSKSLIDPYDVLHLIFEPASYITQNSSSELLTPSQRPSFENAGLTCYTVLSPSITFSVSLLAQTYHFRTCCPPPYYVSVCQTVTQ